MTPLHALAMKSSGVGRREGGDGRRFHQVWSLTQICSADFSQPTIVVKRVFTVFTNTQSKFASRVIDGVMDICSLLIIVIVQL